MTYYEIGTKSTIVKELEEFAMAPANWTPHYNFKARIIPAELIFKDNLFLWLAKRYIFIAGILKLDPYVCYAWHTDSRREAGINMILTPNQRSFCVFTDAKYDEEPVFKIKELAYKPMTYYVFNTKVSHTVYNFESTRYLLSIDFIDTHNKGLTYDILVQDIKDNYEKNCTE